MQRFTSVVLTTSLLIAFLVAFERRAYGYVDPGSGLLALQGFASVVAGGLFYMRRRILALFKRKDSVAQPTVAETTTRRSS